MTCTCEKCNQKRVIDCLFVKVDVNLHIARQTKLFWKVNSLSSGTMAESCWESSSEEELFLTQSTFTVKSDKYDAKYLLSVVAIPFVLRLRITRCCNCCSGMGVSTSEGDGKCSEDNVVIREGVYYFKLFIKVLEANMDANVLF